MLSRLARFTPLALLPIAAFTIACESDLDVGTAKGFINGDPGCIGQVCGDECNVCDPADTSCVETAVVKECGSTGLCRADVATCGGADGGCDYDGTRYDEGASFPSSDGCNTCSCEDGGVACTEMACDPGGCDYEGKHYEEGASFPSTDGCNNCGCSGGDVVCTLMACAYAPCGGKSCGDECTICDPADASCSETAVLKQCDENGTCSANANVCD